MALFQKSLIATSVLPAQPLDLCPATWTSESEKENQNHLNIPPGDKLEAEHQEVRQRFHDIGRQKDARPDPLCMISHRSCTSCMLFSFLILCITLLKSRTVFVWRYGFQIISDDLTVDQVGLCGYPRTLALGSTLWLLRGQIG